MSYRRRRGLGGRSGRSGDTGGVGREPGDEPAGGRAGAIRVLLARARGKFRRAPTGRWVIAAVVTALCFGAGYLVAAGWLLPDGGRDDADLIRIPELVGLTEEEARERLEGVGLEDAVRAGMAHPRAPEGAVIAQNPLPGQLARPGAPVSLTLSRGPEAHVLPDVAGLSSRQASIVLERLGYTVREERVQHAAERGRAVSTRPEPGTELAVPADVVLLVSEGPPVVQVPDLRGRHVDDVAAALEEAGLTLGVVTFDASAAEAPGRVVGQYPPAGYRLREGASVEVRVAGEAGSAAISGAPSGPARRQG